MNFMKTQQTQFSCWYCDTRSQTYMEIQTKSVSQVGKLITQELFVA